jgi:hypothetical protein
MIADDSATLKRRGWQTTYVLEESKSKIRTRCPRLSTLIAATIAAARTWR